MLKGKWALISSLLIFGLSPCSTAIAQSHRPSPQDFSREFSNVQISPDGLHVATIGPFDGRSALVIYRFDSTPAEGGEDIIAIPSGDDVEISGYMWASNDRLLIQAGFSFENLQGWHERFDEFEGTQLIAIGIDGSNPIVLGSYGLASVANRLPQDPDHVLIVTPAIRYAGFIHDDPRLSRVNIRNGDYNDIRAGRREVGWLWTSQAGRLSLMFHRNYNDFFEIYWRGARGGWRRIHRQRDEDGIVLVPFAVLNGGSDVYLMSNHEGRRGLYVIRPEQSSELQRVFLHDQYDVATLGYSPLTDQPTFVSFTTDLSHRHYFDPQAQGLDERAAAALPGAYAFVTSQSDSQSRMVFSTDGPGHPPQYYLFDRDTGAYRLFAPSYPTLRDDQLASVETVSYQARDGLTIHGYLATPIGLGDGPQPLIVLPHGGPAARDRLDFDVLRQFFATRGYVVFQPNYRGSTGYGNDFFQAGWEEWGRGMQDDVTDGVRYLIGEGIADPDRICIAGWSYGAYAALLGAATTPELYQCAIGINGVYDIEQLRDPRNLRYSDLVAVDWEQYLGDDVYSLSAQRDLSPRYLASDIVAPVLIIASAQDPQARIAHSEDMITALRAAGATPESRLFEAGDHSLSYGPAWEEAFDLIDNFLAQHLQ